MAKIVEISGLICIILLSLQTRADEKDVQFSASYLENGFTHDGRVSFSGSGPKSVVKINANSNLLITSQDKTYLGEWIVQPNDRLRFYLLDFEQIAAREKRKRKINPINLIPQRASHSVRITINGVSIEERQIAKLDSFFDALKDAQQIQITKATVYRFKNEDVVFKSSVDDKVVKKGSFNVNRFCTKRVDFYDCKLPQGFISQKIAPKI